jgi:hypothetical protein
MATEGVRVGKYLADAIKAQVSGNGPSGNGPSGNGLSGNGLSGNGLRGDGKCLADAIEARFGLSAAW